MDDQSIERIANTCPELLSMNIDQIRNRLYLLQNDIEVMESELNRIAYDTNAMLSELRDNKEKIRLNKNLPYLVGNIVEILDLPKAEEGEDGANVDLHGRVSGRCAIVRTSTRTTAFLPMIGLVDPKKVAPNDLVGLHKDTYLVLKSLPQEYDTRVRAMEVESRPLESYNDIGGLDKQIEELVEAIVLPLTSSASFDALNILPPKGVLMYGPPGTGKTLLARACAASTKSTFIKLAGPQLVQMYIGEGAKLVRDAFALAKERAPTIIFIDELDAIGSKRFNSEKSGDREVQRTMLELLNQMDGFSSSYNVKVIAATNRVDVLDPALLRSGRFDRKVEFPLPDERARAQITRIHARQMTLDERINFDELAKSCDGFNGAQLKAVCVEAGMIALRRNDERVRHEDFVDGIFEVQSKKKATMRYFV